MKINEIVYEGIGDWARKIGSGIQGAIRNVQAGRAQRAEKEELKKVADHYFQKWNQEVARHPNVAPGQLNQILTNWANQQFHDRPNSNVAIPSGVLNNNIIYDYIFKRIQEYFQAAPATTSTPSQLPTDYAYPRVDAELNVQGHIIYYDSKKKTWTYKENGQEIKVPKDIQFLNKTYHDIKLAIQSGKQIKNPDLEAATAQQQFDFSAPGAGSNITNISSARPPTNVTESAVINEGGNAIANSVPVNQDDVKTVVELAKKLIPAELTPQLQTDIGSAGYKLQSGDIDLMVEAEDVIKLFKTEDSKDPVKEAKQKLKSYFENKGIEANVNGRNVSIGIVYVAGKTRKKQIAQVDVMIIKEASIVAPWHQHGLRGMYSDPEFKGSEVFMLISSIAKYLGLKFDPFGANLIRRDDNEIVGRTRKEVAKILLGPKAKENDLNSVKTILKALENDPDKEGKLSQARQDAAKGLMKLPETIQPGTAAWFRQISNSL